MHKRSRVSGVLALVPILMALGLTSVLAAEGDDVLARFQKNEILNLDWPRTMLTYRVQFEPGEANRGKVRLLDGAGEAHPVQLWDIKQHEDGSVASARISFMAELGKGGSYDYRLVQGERRSTKNVVKASTDKKYLTLSNEKVAFRMPAPGSHEFENPLRFGKSHKKMISHYGAQTENGIIPGPFQGLRLVDGQWVGGSYFWSKNPDNTPRVTSYTCEVTEQGPVFAEARVRYSFTNGGWYQMTVRLRSGAPWVHVDEQFDLRRTGSGYTWRLMTSFSSAWKENGWQPDIAYWHVSRRGGRKGKVSSFREKLADLGYDVDPYKGRTFGSKKIRYKKRYEKVFNVACWFPWAPSAQYFGLIQEEDLEKASGKEAGVPFLAVVPIHAGTWRSGHNSYRTTMLFTHNVPDVDLNWPLMAEKHPNTLLQTGEYDPDKPLSYVRRQWALVGGPLQFHDTLFDFRRYEGYINLDDYKDWVLDWQTEEPVSYPRLLFSREDIDRFQEKLADHNAGNWLKESLYLQDSEKKRNNLWGRLTDGSQWHGPVGQAREAVRSDKDSTPYQSSYRQSQMAAQWTPWADELLSSDNLSPERRQRLRRYIAAVSHALAEPDFNPRGSMIHLGTPNMAINRTLALAFTASLIPEHPRAQDWLDMIGEFEKYKLAMNVAPEGAWSELITYFAASAPHLMQAGMVLEKGGRLDDRTSRLCTLPARFTLQLLSPEDPRFGTRVLPAWGHEGAKVGAHWLVAAALARRNNPRLAQALAWAWEALDRPLKTHHSGNFGKWATVHADLAKEGNSGSVPGYLKSKRLPGFGAVLRAHAGDPNETYLSYRQGYLTSHCDANQGDFAIFSKGAPLINLSLRAYAIQQLKNYKKLYNQFGWHSRVRFGRKSNTGGWPGGGPASQVHRKFLSESVDYIRGLGDYGPQRWARQIIFLKGKKATGPNYFVFRDSFSPRKKGKELQKKWWYLRTLGPKANVRTAQNELLYKSPFGHYLDVHFLQPDSIEVESREESGHGPMYHAVAKNWRKAHGTEGEGRNRNKAGFKETITVNAVGPVEAGQDIVTVLYPRADGESGPQYEVLGPGAARISTEEATDYVFVDHEPMKYNGPEVDFRGVAGAVRVYPEEVHLVIAEGGGVVAYRGAKLRAEIPAIRVVPKDELGSETIRVAAPEHDIKFSAPQGSQTQRVQDGVMRYEFDGGFAYGFDFNTPSTWEGQGVRFEGRRGGIIVRQKGAVSLVLEKGRSVSYKKLESWGAGGPYALTFHENRITGRTAGQDRFLYLTRPAALDRLPTLVIDGQTYAPGTSGETLIVPVLAGEHDFEIRILKQPPIIHN
ncbi:MAG: hypothetical protein KGZ25_03615 [Planctomycetes bacterium]|nr:hypothetical protein [Planctomycetota bacterium]